MKYETVLFDLDGTVYAGNTILPGAKETIEKLKAKGVRVLYITNSSTRSRKTLVEKLKKMGIEAHRHEIYTSGYVTAKHIKEQRPGKTVLCISSGGMQEELLELGVKLVEENADIVTMGLDRTFTYEKLVHAHRAIEAGAEFIVSNKDHRFPVEDGFLPGAGALIAALEYSTEKKAVCMGKPNKRFMEFIIAHEKLDRKKCLVVGDNIHTDIELGLRSKIDTALVLGGVTSKEELKEGKKQPTYVLGKIKDVITLV